MSSTDILKAEILFGASQSQLLSEASALQASKPFIPSIAKYFPQSVSEIEVQEFNTAGKIPSRLASSEDGIALWLLESEELDRTKVSQFLTLDDAESRVVLEKIAIKICSLEIAHGFVDGLKFFLPVVGCFDINKGTSTEVSANLTPQELNTLRYVLKIYVQAHLYYSKNPIFDTPTGMENLAILIDLALSVLDLCLILHLKKKSQTIAMSDFFGVLRTLFRRGNNLTLSIKKMTDLFNSSNTGRGLSALKLPQGLPSYLFGQVKREGFVSLGYSLDTPFQMYYARLSYNALYLFDTSTEVSLAKYESGASPRSAPHRLVLCIPLETVHIQLMDRTEQYVSISGGDGEGTDCDSLLEFMSISDSTFPVIEFSHKGHYAPPSGSSAQEWLAPCSVAYHPSVFVNIDAFRNRPDPSEAGEVSSNSELSLWMDALENSCWESRVTKNNTVHHK